MSERIDNALKKNRLVPVIAVPVAEDIVPLCEALRAGGLTVAEITFRTEAGQKALRLAREQFPDFLIGAGTVTRLEELEAAKDAGADFAVAPGLNPRIVSRAVEIGLSFSPGICTPSDIEAALELGVTTLKFFPAEAAGGVKMIKAIHAPYKHRGVKFVPTGGIGIGNMKDYLALDSVHAIGGSWFVNGDLIKAGNWTEITRLTKEAVALAGN